MNKSEMDNLDIVSFSQLQGSAVSEFLTHEGFNTTHLCAREWLSSEPSAQPGITLLVLDSLEERDSIIDRLSFSRENKYIGVLGHSPQLWQQKFLDYFDDYIGWPCNRDELIYKLKRQQSPPPQTPDNRDHLLNEFSEFNIIGKSEKLVATLSLIKKISNYDAPTLISGETGTGKELAARAIHYIGARQGKAFIPVNCGAIPEELIENELFGHEKGAYTDAASSQHGVVELARGGTLFLDEVDALPAKAQVALLRLIQEDEYRPLGGNTFKCADIRIIAATNSNLEQAVLRGTFREDLLFRLNVLNVNIPPLRERLDDLELLSAHLLKKIALQNNQQPKRIHHTLLLWMRAQEWPGNIRQLENTLYRMALLSETPILRHELYSHYPDTEGSTGISDSSTPFERCSFKAAKEKVIATFERSYLLWLMQTTGGNISEAARKTGKERRALGKLLKKHNIDRTQFATGQV